MDLTRLYNLTTPELRDEAERLGVSDTYAMSRGQLIQAIRDRSGPPRNDGLLGKVFGFAKWAIQAAAETQASEPVPQPEPVPESAPVPVPIPEPVAASDPEPDPVPETAPVPEPARIPEPVAASDLEPDPVPETAPDPGPEPEPAPVIETGPPSRPPAGVFSNTSSPYEEPFPTRTMARILADQGHYKRSLAIYGRLLSEEPGDGDLVAEAEAVRTQARARRSHAPQ